MKPACWTIAAFLPWRGLGRAGLGRRLAGLPGDQSGSISIASVFALLLIVLLLGMVMNTGRQVDHKIKMQNAADAAAHAGGVVLARNMNTLAFANHLLCEVFALTAFLREAEARAAEGMTEEILNYWELVAPLFAGRVDPADAPGATYPRFEPLGQAIPQKVSGPPLVAMAGGEMLGGERAMVRAYGDWAAAAAEIMLPMMEWILDGDSVAASDRRPIPEFERALVLATPRMVQETVDEVGRRHGLAWPGASLDDAESRLHAVLWRTSPQVEPVGGASESQQSTLPAVDPTSNSGCACQPQGDHLVEIAREQRCLAAHAYFGSWHESMLLAFDHVGKMSAYGSLWRALARGRLKRLLNIEYHSTNLPHLIRMTRRDLGQQGVNINAHLEQTFMFVGVVYRKKMESETGASRVWMSKYFRNPIDSDTVAYAQTMLMTPRPRLDYFWPGSPLPPSIGGVPGNERDDPEPPEEQEEAGDEEESDSDEEEDSGQTRPPQQVVARESPWHSWHSPQWDLMNQNWTTQLVPATTSALPAILSQLPYGLTGFRVPESLSGLSAEEIQRISQH